MADTKLVNNNTKRINVCLRVIDTFFGFWSHIAISPHTDSNPCQNLRLSFLVRVLHKTKIRDFVLTIREFKDVFRLQISMKVTFIMNVAYTTQYHADNFKFFFISETTATNVSFEIFFS